MLDAYIRPIIGPPLDKAGILLARRGAHPHGVTAVGFVAGLIAIVLITQHYYILAGCFIVFNRLCDGLDGAVARESGMTDFGGFLDISCDFIIYAGVIFGFAVAQPDSALWASFLLFSYIGPITTFLAYALMAEKYKVTTEIRGKKSFYYLGGLCEGSETAIVMILLCLKPEWLSEICVIFGAMCWLTTIGRIRSAFLLASYIPQATKIKQPGPQKL